jgi:hypothetical protein
MLRILFWLTLIALLIAAWLMWALVRPWLFERRVKRALRQFNRRRTELESKFFQAAASSGKPRGLAWKSCAFQKEVLLARDRANGDLVGLVGVTIAFEAIVGGGMEDVEAVGNLRAATAVFTHNGNEWTTSGRAVFNLESREVIERYHDKLDRV